MMLLLVINKVTYYVVMCYVVTLCFMFQIKINI